MLHHQSLGKNKNIYPMIVNNIQFCDFIESATPRFSYNEPVVCGKMRVHIDLSFSIA